MPIERRQRRLVLYIFGSTLLVLISHAALTTSPVGESAEASRYGRYTESVVAWREKGIAAMNGAVDGWKQAGSAQRTGANEEAQEYLESFIPENGPLQGEEDRDRTEGEGPVVEEVEEGQAHRVPEQTYAWPATWPEEDKGEPTREQIQEEEQVQEVQMDEQHDDQQDGQQEEGQEGGMDEAQSQDEHPEGGEQDEHREDDNQDGDREGESEHQDSHVEEQEEQGNGDREQTDDGEGEELQNGEDRQDDNNDPSEEQHENQDEGEHRDEEQNEQTQESQDGNFAWPDHSAELDAQREEQENGDLQTPPSESTSDGDGFFPSLHPAPPSVPESSPGSDSDSEPKESPSTDTFPFSITLPEHLRLHHPGDQPRIVILQHVFPSDTVSRKLFSLSEAAYRTYAKHWGYKYVRDDGVYMPNEYEARRKGMNKLYPVLRVMIEELGKADGAEWMLMTDADTVPINPSIPLHTLIPPSSHVWFMGNEDWNGFNAGNMLLRISRETVAFMSHVISREVDMSRFENTGKYTSGPPSDQEALCLSMSEPEWRDNFYKIPMKWINAYSSPYEKGQDEGGPITLPWTDGGEQQPGVWTPQVNFHLVFILKHYRETEKLQEQIERVWRKMADDQEWAGDVRAKTEFAASLWWDQFKDGDRWKKGGSPKCMGF